MQSRIWYTGSGRLEKMIKEKGVIPHSIFPGEKLIRNHHYYDFMYNKIYRVISAEYKNGEFEGAYIKNDDNTYAWIVDLPNPSYDYYITYDKLNMWKKEIINTGKSYTGAEIRYWFFRNDIDMFNETYAVFWKYVEQSGNDAIEDKFFYRLIGKKDENGIYTDCRVERVFKNDLSNLSKEEEEYNKKYWAGLKQRDQSRINKKMKRSQE